MKGMNIKVKLDMNKIKKLSKTQIDSVKITAEQLLHEIVTDAVIPFDEGTLQNVQTYIEYENVGKGDVKIVHETPYAMRLYYNPQFNFDQTINKFAKGEWWEEYISGAKKDRPKEIYKQAYKHLSGGLVK